MANPSWSPLSSSLAPPSPPPLFRRFSEDQEWSPLWLTTPPIRKTCPLPTYPESVPSSRLIPPPRKIKTDILENPSWSPLSPPVLSLRKSVTRPTYQMLVAITLSDSLIVAQTVEQPESTIVANVAALQPVNESEVDAIDMSLVPVSYHEPSPNLESDSPIGPTLNVRATLVSLQESVLLRYYRHERPIAIVRPVLKTPTKLAEADNLLGKCSRFKRKLHHNAHWSNVSENLPCPIMNQARHRIAVAPNDNSHGKSNRFKGLAIVRVQTSFLKIPSMS